MPLTTELRWDGKYDAKGARVLPLRVKLPFQDVETVNESTLSRRTLFRTQLDAQPWRNRLIWGDKKYVLPALLDEFAGKVNLIYIDPPFDTGADFSFTAAVPDAPEGEGEGEDDAGGLAFTKEPSIIEEKAYRDTWGRRIDSYLQWFHETIMLLHELLADTGSIYVHLDWHVGHYGKVVLDEILGVENFRSEIIREKANPKNYTKSAFGNVHDVVFFYSKSENTTWNRPYIARDDAKLASDFPALDKTGRRYKTAPLHAPGIRFGETGKPWRDLMPPPGNHWRYVHATLERLDGEARIEWSSTGNPREKIFADESEGLFLQDIWLGVKDVKGDYPSMKNPEILERIIKASSNDDDLILDCFSGSGTTAAVAEKLGRRWIDCDLGRFAIHTTRKRLLNIEGVKPFLVQNLGKYERQLWQTGAFAAGDDRSLALAAGSSGSSEEAERQRKYTEFILKLYHATPLAGGALLHGVKNGRLVHVGGVEAPVSDGDVRQIAVEFKRRMGTGKDEPTKNEVDVLGWDFAFELNEVAQQQAERANLKLRFLRIPRDVMDKRAVDQGDVKFFELAALSAAAKTKGSDVSLSLTNFVIPPDDVPEEVRTAVKHWSQWIDYWAVDWDHDGKTFHNQWQTFRTRKQPKLEPAAVHHYETAGEYNVMVKVIDILGNDTTKTIRVSVK